METIVLGGGCFWCLESGYSYFLFKIKELRFVKTIFDKFLSSTIAITLPGGTA